jgi:hypothetical protein
MSIRLIPICITSISWFGKKKAPIVLGVRRPGGMRHREEAEADAAIQESWLPCVSSGIARIRATGIAMAAEIGIE